MSAVRRRIAYAVLIPAAALYFGRHVMALRHGGAFRAAASHVESSEELARALGGNVRIGPFPRGGRNPAEDPDAWAFVMGVQGPRDDGRVVVGVERFDRRWRVTRVRYTTDRGRRGRLTSLDVERLRRGETEVSRALALHRRGRHREALEVFDAALRHDPENTDGLFWRGWTHVALDRPEDAIADFRRVLEIDVDFPGAHAALGNALGRAGRYEASLTMLNIAIERSPDCGMCRFSRAATHQELGREAAMVTDLEAACELEYDDACAALQTLEAQ